MTQHRLGTVGLVVALLVGSLAGAGLTLSAVGPAAPGTTGPATETPVDDGVAPTDPLTSDQTAMTQFADREAFEAYVGAGQRLSGGYPGARFAGGRPTETNVTVDGGPAVVMRADAAGGDAGSSGGDTAPARMAGTNVQVAGLDEPDVVKTDGEHFYYAPENRRYYIEPRPAVGEAREGGVAPPEKRRQSKTHVVDASDPDAPSVVEHIDTSGKLLQTGDRLVVFESDRIAGYDVSDPENPTEAWSHPLNGTLVTARERNGTVYVVTASGVGYDAPCPVEPLGGDAAVACTDIYRPGTQIPVDATYTAISLDAGDGGVDDTVSFVGTRQNTVVYASHDALYVTYTKSTDRGTLVAEFLREEFDRTPESVAERIAEIQSYDISAESKQRETWRAVRGWLDSLPAEQRRDVQRDLDDGLSEYIAEHQRTLTQTGIVRVDIDGGALDVAATGAVPGRPLDQFSLSEYDGTLRVATTIPAASSADSENDLYTLDAETLDRRGAVTGMGETERVYSVRYVDDTAYVVTFRRIDPFHVVDLSDPDDPALVGELKLPGYSSYLHPIDEDHVLGIGEEDGRVKTVLFDVSDPSDPTIDDSEVLDRPYSAVAETHHAFLIDRKHGVFVLPAGTESVVMDYTGGELAVETTVPTSEPATRARYVGDSLYVFAGDTLTVVDETTWERTTTLDLSE